MEVLALLFVAVVNLLPLDKPMEQHLCPAPKKVLLVACPAPETITTMSISCKKWNKIDTCSTI